MIPFTIEIIKAINEKKNETANNKNGSH